MERCESLSFSSISWALVGKGASGSVFLWGKCVEKSKTLFIMCNDMWLWLDENMGFEIWKMTFIPAIYCIVGF